MKSTRPGERRLCLWFPDWPMQRLLVARPDDRRRAVLLIERTGRGEFVRYGNRVAGSLGIAAGMPLAEARVCAESRSLVCEPVDRDADRRALVQLAARCERFSFRVGLEEADRPECLVMDVTGIAHFFDGEQSLADQLGRRLRERGFDGRIAVAGTIGAAWAAARHLAQCGEPVVVGEAEDDGDDAFHVVTRLPITGLRLSDATVSKLQRVGVRTIDQLLALDRTALMRRFGRDVLLRIDQLTGRLPEPISPCRPPPRYLVSRALEDGLVHPEAIEQWTTSLLSELLESLRPRRWGVRVVAGEFRLEDRSTTEFSLRLCRPVDQRAHLSELLRLQLERLRFASPVLGLSLEALEVGPLEAKQQEFFEGSTRDAAQQFAVLLNRLSSRLGPRAVVAAQLNSDPIPERAVTWIPATEVSAPELIAHELTASSQGAAPCGRFQAWDRPTILFPEPKPLDVMAAAPDGPPAAIFREGRRIDVAAAWGPERIESGWWRDGGVSRDYYRVQTAVGQWWWVFRRRTDGRWFWHGEM